MTLACVRLGLIGLAFLLAVLVGSRAPGAADPEGPLYLDLEWGRVVIEMRPDLAPRHVARIKELVRQGFYDGLPFHRVIAGFMAQTGDPKGDGTGGSGIKIAAEFSRERHARGVVSMARAPDPNSGDSQFFIVYDDAPWLDGQYTVWGRVIEGMEHMDRIRKGNEAGGGRVRDPDRIVRMRLATEGGE